MWGFKPKPAMQVCPICENIFFPGLEKYTTYCSDSCYMVAVARPADAFDKAERYWTQRFGVSLRDDRSGKASSLTCLNCARLRLIGSAFCSVGCVKDYYGRIPNE